MNVDEFLAWAEHRPGRYELVDGEVFAMSPQGARHTRTKYRVQTALDRAIASAGLGCEMLADGMTVQVDPDTAYEPYALVQWGEPVAEDAIAATHAVIVVEVLSPSTGHVDTGQKLEGYFRVPSVMHCLIVDPRRAMVIHHRRGIDGLIETRIASTGLLALDPPALRVPVAEFFAAP